jgi:nucleotide-binding universal stress UspA family protein
MQARLVAVSVIPRYEGNMNRWKITDAEQLEQPFNKCLEDAIDTAASYGQMIVPALRVGAPVEEIVALAEEEEAELLVIGYAERSYVERVLLGRTAAKIIGQSPCDVLIIPEFGKVGFERILVGIDGSGYSMAAGHRALDLARSYGGEVHGLTVLDVPVEKGLHYGVLDEARHKHFTALQVLAGQGEKLGVPVITELREGSAYQDLVRYSEENNIRLIVLGSFGRTALTRLLMGSVVERVAALSRRPTLVVKRPAAEELLDR